MIWTVVSFLIAKRLWKESNFGYQRRYRTRIRRDEIMI